MRVSYVVLALVVLASTVFPLRVVAQGDRPAPSWCVSVWYPSSDHPGGYNSLLAHVASIDEVNPFWYGAAPDGSLLVYTGAEDVEKLAAWDDAGLLVLPTIANASPLAILEPETRAAHIAEIVALVKRMDYAGIDLDYEGFPLNTRDPFSEFVEALAEVLHADGRLLSVTVHAKTADRAAYEGAAAQDWARLAAAADIFRIMTYDFHNRASPDPGPIGPPEWIVDVLQYARSVTDLHKVRVGLHFYGYRWQRSQVATITWESVQHTVESFDLMIERDPVDMEAYVSFKVTGLPKQTIYVADAVGLAYKLDMLRAEFPDLGGAAIWGVGGEDPANWDVLDEYRPGACAY